MPKTDKPRFRSRKNEVATNVLGVCAPDMQLIYVYPGWEGSAADGRVRSNFLGPTTSLLKKGPTTYRILEVISKKNDLLKRET